MNFVHDELVLEVRADLVDKASALVVDQVTKAFLEVCGSYNPEPVAQGLVEVGSGCNYAQVKQ
jgi:DNA polymerase I-like protein with 3'-5' exonuclease and polymerase domains